MIDGYARRLVGRAQSIFNADQRGPIKIARTLSDFSTQHGRPPLVSNRVTDRKPLNVHVHIKYAMGRGCVGINKISHDRLISRKVILCFQKALTVRRVQYELRATRKKPNPPGMKKIDFVFFTHKFLFRPKHLTRSSNVPRWKQFRNSSLLISSWALGDAAKCGWKGRGTVEPSGDKTSFNSCRRTKLGTRTK